MKKKPERLGDAPIEAAYFEKMNVLAGAIDELFNGPGASKEEAPGERKVGFILMVFPFGTEPGRTNYISNANREDVIVLLKEQLARFQGQPEVSGRA